MRATLLLPLLALAFACALPAGAQTVHGTLVDESGGGGVAGALVVLADASGTTWARALTDAAGRFSLRAPAPGRYTLRAERVGHRAASMDVLLEAHRRAEVRLATRPEPFVLPPVDVVADRRCTVRPGQGLAAYALWEQARRALEATAYVEEAELVEYTVRVQRRHVHFRRGRVRTYDDPPRRVTGRPFHTLTPAELAAGGFVREEGDSIAFYGPDARLLLSDEFLDAHCLYADPDASDLRTAALAFTPVRRRERGSIEGVLRIDRATGELRSVEYHFTGLGGSERSTPTGGEVEFRRLPSGVWIVSGWRLRTGYFVRSASASGGFQAPTELRAARGEVTDIVARP